MSRVQEIKAAIEQLSPEERCELATLINPMEDDDWDRQIKKGAEPGGNWIGSWKRLLRNTKKEKVYRFQNP